jgi:RIO-like serine/threonine protein kinase
LIVEALEVMKGIARDARTTWYGQWDGSYVAIVEGNRGADVEVRLVKLGSVTRYRCGRRDVLVAEPHESIINAHALEVLRELRLLPQIEADGVVVPGPRHVLESASARMQMHGVRAVMHGRELKVRA